jgi:hypothetical protein
MPSKPTAEQFIYDCFQERTEALKRELEIHQELRRRFYHARCFWDNRRGVIENSEGGKVVEVSPTDIGANVETTGSCTYCARYRVKSTGESWLIYDVDIRCGRCQKNGADIGCTMCGGTRWQSWKARAPTVWPKRGEQNPDRTMNPTPEEELGHAMPIEPAVEQFMTNHFRERTAALKKEAEIHTAYRKRFYSAECDWDGEELTGHWTGEAEKIMSVTHVNPEVHVVTHGFTLYRLRYHLRPERQSWLIWEVDMECGVCYLQGRRADCFLCRGTGWHICNKTPDE